MAQLLKLNGAAKVVIAANDGMKMDIAEKLNCGDEYVRLKRGGGEDTEAQWKKIKEDYPRESPPFAAGRDVRETDPLDL
jgi:D-arabinitol dehydrogenase (NADP+)